MAILHLLRPHHWIKNFFVLVPAFFAGAALDAVTLKQCGGALLAFCFLASAIYIFNDMRDLEADKGHAKKRTRPLPMGKVSFSTAGLLLILMVVACATVLWWTNAPTGLIYVLAVYAVFNLTYSLGLKQVGLIELFIVASGFMLRLIAGAIAANAVLSDWIIITTGLVALLLAVGKRRGDIVNRHDEAGARKSLASYSVSFLDHAMTMLGAATIVTYLLFCISDYAQAKFGAHVIWSAVPVVFGIMRYLQLALVQGKGDAPVNVLVRDLPLLASIGVYSLFFAALLYIR
jgi:decaprenyl-phosphate phosphoribosyltransferase